MSFFRSPLLRRIIYAIVVAMALTPLATRSHAAAIAVDPPGITVAQALLR